MRWEAIAVRGAVSATIGAALTTTLDLFYVNSGVLAQSSVGLASLVGALLGSALGWRFLMRDDVHAIRPTGASPLAAGNLKKALSPEDHGD